MSDPAIRAALEKRLFDMSDGLEVTVWENSRFTPPAGAYQRAYLLPGPTVNPSYSSGASGTVHTMESGIFQVSLYYPPGDGAIDAYAQAKALKAHFPRGLSLTADGVTVIISGTPSVGPAFDDHGRYVVPVSISYFAHIFT